MVWYALKRIYEIRRYIGKSLITILFIIVMLCSSFCSEAYCSEGIYVQQHTDYYESEDYKQQISGYQGVMESLHNETKNDSSILGYNILEYIKRMVTLDWKNITGAEEYEILLAEVMMNDFSMSGMEEQYKDHLGNAVIEVGKAINKNFENVVNKGNATKINEARKKYQELFSKLENLDYGTDEYKKAYDEYKNWVNANTDLVKKKTFANHLGIAITATASVVKTNADFLTYLEYAEAYNLMSDDFVKVLKRYQELLNNQDEVKRIKEKYNINDPFFVEALISGINNFIERMEKYKGKNNIQLAEELIKETGDNLTYDVTTDKLSDVLKGVFPLINGTLILSEVGQIVMDNADSDYDKIAYSGNMIARMYYVQAFMKETVDVLGMELSSQPDYEHAQLFDESVNIYKATMSNSTKYAQLYTEKKLEEFSNEIKEKENSWWPLDKKRVSKLKSWVEKFEKYKEELETFANSIAEVNCHNSDIMVVEIEDQETIDKDDLFDDLGRGTTALLQDYVAQRDFMYGESYKYTLYPVSQYNPEQSEEWEGISPGQSLGYSIEDFDDDGDMELLVVTLADGYHLQFDMYEVIDGKVTLSASKYVDSDDKYPAPQIPNAESYDENLCGVLSCCVSDKDHRIFLQSNDILWLGGGEEVFVVSVIYKNNAFSDYKVSHLMCNGLMDFERITINQELSDMGVPNPDIARIFNEYLPVVECFDGGAHEILHAEQHGIDSEMMNNEYLKVVSQTTFFTNDKKAMNDVSADDSELKSNKADVIDEYKSFIRSKNNSYRIYDIDKDGYPELFFSEMHYEDREAFCDIYTYSDGEFKILDRTHGYIFWQEFPIYASYPNGNGIVQYGWGKGREIVTVEVWNGGVNESESIYFTNYLEDNTKDEQVYYKDVNDAAYGTEINHQFYQSGTSSPYFEGSYLLAYSAMDDFTAVYEAFGVEEETDASTEKSNHKFMGISKLDSGVEISTITNGNTYRIRYDYSGGDYEYGELKLSVNNSVESYRLDAVDYPEIENVYVTDIDTADSYANIIVVVWGEGDDSSTYLFAFNDDEIRLIAESHGRLVPESVGGDGKVFLVYWIGMGIQGYGSFTVRPEIEVHDLSAKVVRLHSGRTVYSETGDTYEEAFRVPLYSELTVYSEPSCTSEAGMIPAGNSVICEFVQYGEYDYRFYVSGGNVEGYVTSHMLKVSCDDIYFVG